MRGRAPRHRPTAVGARAAGVATDAAGDRRALVPVCRVRSCVAAGHHQGGGAESEDLPGRAAVGSGRVGHPAPDDGADRRRACRRVAHRERRCSRRGAAGPDQRPGAVRRGCCHRRRRTRVAIHQEGRHAHRCPYATLLDSTVRPSCSMMRSALLGIFSVWRRAPTSARDPAIRRSKKVRRCWSGIPSPRAGMQLGNH